MKKALLMTAALMVVSGAGEARERQVYSPYPQANFNYDDSASSNVSPQAIAPQAGEGRLYPGREGYGREFGPIPRHPGDYRDAVDRGAWQPNPDGGSKGFYGW